MLAYSYISNNLNHLDRLYRSATSVKDASYSSKLAILELCGWIEVSMDDIILRGCVRALKEEQNRKALREKVKRNYGFEYDRHFVSLVSSLVGLYGYEKIDKSVPTSVSVGLKAELSNLKDRRNSLAHTYFKGVTQHYDAPSITIGRFNTVRVGLEAYDKALRAYC